MYGNRKTKRYDEFAVAAFGQFDSRERHVLILLNSRHDETDAKVDKCIHGLVTVTDELKNYFRPEFLNRIDETVVFHALDAKNIESIARIQLQVLLQRLQKMDLEMDVSEAAIAELAKVGFDPVFGARPLKRAIQQRIENPLSKLLLEGKFMPKDGIAVSVDPVRAPGEFGFTKVAAV